MPSLHSFFWFEKMMALGIFVWIVAPCKITVKDRFPIPTMDELLNERWCAKFFSKLDLRFGIH